MNDGKHQHRAGVRFSYLLRQLDEAGMSQTAIADAIGCHQTLISKWWWRGSIGADLTQKYLRSDVVQGIVDGLGIRSDYLFMPTPREYHKRIRLPNGETRPADPDELDHTEFKLITNEQMQAARERKEVKEVRAEVADLRRTVEANNRQLAQLLALLASSTKFTP